MVSRNFLEINNTIFYPRIDISDNEYINSLKTRGLKYILILKKSFGKDVKLKMYEQIFENKDHKIYRI